MFIAAVWKNPYKTTVQIAAPFFLEGLRYGWHIDPEPSDDGEPVFEQPVLDPCARCLSSGGTWAWLRAKGLGLGMLQRPKSLLSL